MIKKIIVIFLSVSLFLSGCNFSDYLEPEKRSIVTCVYLFGTAKEISILLETVKPNSEGQDEGYFPEYLLGEGEDFNKALKNAQLNFNKEFSLYHCPLIICEESLYAALSGEIFSQILSVNQISLAANFLLTENLFKNIEEKSSEVFLGYEVSDVIQLKDVESSLISILNDEEKPKILIFKENRYNIAENNDE